MTKAVSNQLELINSNCDNHHEMETEVYDGLTSPQKYLPSKYFYDSFGSSVFEKICDLPEYYPTRVEMNILERNAPDIMSGMNRGDLVELGAGGNRKIKVLLDAAGPSRISQIRYVPVDVCESALKESSRELRDLYPQLTICCVTADFTRDLKPIPQEGNKLIAFFGSTIGNLTDKQSARMLRKMGGLMEPEDRLLIGMDMTKPKEVLEAAYNDAEGMTALFNKNILTVMNRELDAEFDQRHFDHLAFYNEGEERVEMHLRANRPVSVRIGKLDLQVTMNTGETILTEICRKFSRRSIEQMAMHAGMTIRRWFADARKMFSLVELSVIHVQRKDVPQKTGNVVWEDVLDLAA